MAITSKALANYLLDLAADDGIDVSPMKLQKLVYYCQGWYLAITDEPLIDEQIEAWKFGPVVDSLFHEFKAYGRMPISSRATRFIQSDSSEDFFGFCSIVPAIDDECDDADEAETIKQVVKRVWDVYKAYSAERLSNMTHQAGGPWAVTVDKFNGNPPKGTDIPVPLIAEHFAASLNRHLGK